MKKLAFIVAAASLFALEPIAHRYGPVASSVVLVWMAVLLAVCASSSINALAVASGAAGAFGAGVLGTFSPAVAGAVLVLAAFAERTTRIRSRTSRAVHILTALVGGALGGTLATAYATASLPVVAVAVAVAAVLAALPLVVEADDPVAHALEHAAKAVSEPARSALRDGAELRRRAEDVPLERPARVRIDKTWQALLRLAEARMRLERSSPKRLVRIADEGTLAPSSALAPPSAADAVLGMVDQRITDHVSALSKALSAVDTARAAAVGIDDAELRNMDTLGDLLEDESRAMVEVKAGGVG